MGNAYSLSGVCLQRKRNKSGHILSKIQHGFSFRGAEQSAGCYTLLCPVEHTLLRNQAILFIGIA